MTMLDRLLTVLDQTADYIGQTADCGGMVHISGLHPELCGVHAGQQRAGSVLFGQQVSTGPEQHSKVYASGESAGQRQDRVVRTTCVSSVLCGKQVIIKIITYIHHVLSAHMIHMNLDTIFYTHVEHSPTKTIYLK